MSTITTLGTDCGPACPRCAGTIYSYDIDDAAGTALDDIKATCAVCHKQSWFVAYGADARHDANVREVREAHAAYVERNRRHMEAR